MGLDGCFQRKRKQSVCGCFQTQYDEKVVKFLIHSVLDHQTKEEIPLKKAEWSDVPQVVLIFALERQSKKFLNKILSEVQKWRVQLSLYFQLQRNLKSLVVSIFQLLLLGMSELILPVKSSDVLHHFLLL